MRHRPQRLWWAPWRTRCACRWPYYPCPDVAPNGGLYPAPQYGNAGPAWNGPTLAVDRYRLTAGQARRSRQGGRWQP